MTAQLSGLVGEAARWYHHQLLHSPAAHPARAYLETRGVDFTMLEEFEVGWAPAGWDDLVRHLEAGADEITAAGLGYVNRSGRLQDFFRGRIVFPVHDVAERPIGFGGRLLPGVDGPKYLNSPEGPLYRKSEVLYGIHRAAAEMAETGVAVVCEGYLDVIAVRGAGIGSAVASCGTALGSEHLAMVGLVADKAVLAFDADDAGHDAAVRAWQLDDHGLELFVATLPEGSDPAAVALSDPDRLRSAIDDAEPLLEWLINRAVAEGPSETIEQRVRTAERALELIVRHPRRFTQDELMMGVAVRLSLDSSLLRARLDEVRHAGHDRPAGDVEHSVRRDGPVIAELELAALGIAIHADTVSRPWWFHTSLFHDAGARSVIGAMTAQHHMAIDTAAPLDDEGTALVASTSAPIGDVDLDEVGVRLVRAALERAASSLGDDVEALTRVRRQIHSISTARGANQIAAAKAGLALLIGL